MRILAALDTTDASRLVVAQARKLAEAFSAKLWLLHVAEPEPDFVGYEVGPQSVRDFVAQRFHQEHRLLQDFAQELRAAGVDCTALLIQGATVESILDEARKLEADMLVIGSHGKGVVKQLLLGSVSEGLIRHAALPVLVVPTHGRA